MFPQKCLRLHANFLYLTYHATSPKQRQKKQIRVHTPTPVQLTDTAGMLFMDRWLFCRRWRPRQHSVPLFLIIFCVVTALYSCQHTCRIICMNSDHYFQSYTHLFMMYSIVTEYLIKNTIPCSPPHLPRAHVYISLVGALF